MNVIEYPSSKEASGLLECLWYIPVNETVLLIPDGIYNDLIGEVSLITNQCECPLSRDFLCLPLLKQAILIKTKSPVLVVRKKAFIKLSNTKSGSFMKSLRGFIKMHETELDVNRLDDVIHDLCDLYEGSYYRVPVLTELINEILFKKGQIRLSELYLNWNLSKQAVSKTYASKIDISLKELSTIWRLNDFLINLQRNDSLTSAFVDAGFFDQAHGIKSFRKFYNINPSAFQIEHQGILPSIITPIQKRFNGLYNPVNS